MCKTFLLVFGFSEKTNDLMIIMICAQNPSPLTCFPWFSDWTMHWLIDWMMLGWFESVDWFESCLEESIWKFKIQNMKMIDLDDWLIWVVSWREHLKIFIYRINIRKPMETGSGESQKRLAKSIKSLWCLRKIAIRRELPTYVRQLPHSRHSLKVAG